MLLLLRVVLLLVMCCCCCCGRGLGLPVLLLLLLLLLPMHLRDAHWLPARLCHGLRRHLLQTVVAAAAIAGKIVSGLRCLVSQERVNSRKCANGYRVYTAVVTLRQPKRTCGVNVMVTSAVQYPVLALRFDKNTPSCSINLVRWDGACSSKPADTERLRNIDRRTNKHTYVHSQPQNTVLHSSFLSPRLADLFCSRNPVKNSTKREHDLAHFHSPEADSRPASCSAR